MRYRTPVAAAIALVVAGLASAAPPKVVTAPNSDPQCFAPWAANTKLFQYPAKKGPYRIALANGYIANTWRIQMIKTAKAYAAQPEVAAKLKEFKVVSTGEDVAAQIAAINNFIDSGYDAIVVNAQNPAAFKPVIKRANDAGVVLVAFDNILDTEEAINVNVDQKGLGKYWAEWLVKNVPNGGKVLEVRGVSGTSVDRDRHEGIQEVFKASGKKWDTVEVIGKWDDPTAQKVTADAIAVHKKFDGITAQGGDTGVVQAMIDAKHPFVPFGGETENGFRKFCGKYGAQGLKCCVGRHRPGAGRGGDQDGDRGARREGRAAVGEAAARQGRVSEHEGGDRLLPRAERQLLRRQLLPDLRHQFHRAGNHGTDRSEQVGAAAGTPVPAFGHELVRHAGRVQAFRRRARALGRRLVIEAGRIHAVLGENGAGKSTLIKIIAGVVAPDEGRMMLDGEPVSFASPAAANAAGIACIFQELSLIPDLSVADNIAISNPPRRYGLIDRPAQRRMAEESLARAGAGDIHPLALVKDLSLSRRQMVEIAKALVRKPRILILDEATSALTAADVTTIYGVLKRLREEGLALIYISHRMHEIAELADECTVFCNGRSVASYAAGTKSDNEVVELMIGREYSAVFPARPARAVSVCGAAPRGAPPELGRSPGRYLAAAARGRGDRPRRTGRPGSARAAARAVRRAARHDGQCRRRWRACRDHAVLTSRRKRRSAWR